MKIYVSTILILVVFLFATIPHNITAATCTCFDPSTNSAVGPTFQAPAGNDCSDPSPGGCQETCRLTSPDYRCFLCAPEGSVDCSNLGGNPTSGGGSSFSIENLFINIGFGINNIIIWLFLLATVILLIGIVRYITAGGDEEKLKNARALIIYGVIGLAVMVTVWAFVTIVIDFFFESGTDITIPGSDIVNPL